MNEILKVIDNPNSSNAVLLKALSNLSEAKEGSKFWVDIANDNKYNEDHRRRAIFMLFKRHINSGITLETLSKILHQPNWLTPDNIHLVQAIGGVIPISFNFDDTILAIQIFPNLSDGRFENWAIFLRIAGKISVEDFYKIISSGGKNGMTELKERKLLEFGLSPDTPEINH